ncbi:MAG: hypothetical protein JO136_11800 [Hyphomicrobiales bacterium]|nr:hypothetical protein [Hyphomicrobiales bacterium]
MENFSVGSAAMNLIYRILGRETNDLRDICKDLAAELGLSTLPIFVWRPTRV